MLKYILGIVASVFVCMSFMSTSALSAERVYDNGTIWYVSFVRTKPGKYDDYLATKIQGSVEKSTQADIDREALRTLNGSIILQEVKFIK